MNKRLLCTVMMVIGLALAGPLGCGSDSCDDACSKIYSECGLGITGMTQNDCVAQCESEASKDEDIKCVMDASCEVEAIEACLY